MKRKAEKIVASVMVLIVIVIASGCNGHKAAVNTKDPTRVNVEEAKAVGNNMRIAYSGTIEESVSMSLSFSVPGTVESVKVNEGENVRRGQLLATLNGENYKNMYELAFSKLKQAEDAYKRFEPMFKNKSLPAIKMVEIETGLQGARSSVAIAKKNLDDCRLIAPDDGVIGKRSIEPGTNVLPGIPTFNLVQIEKVFVRIPAPENEVARLKKGIAAEINIPAIGEEVFHGKIDEIGVIANILSRTYDVKIGLNNPLGVIRPGMVCSVILASERNTGVLVIPNRAVMVDEDGENYVYVVNTGQNKAQKRKVTLGSLLKEGISVTSGIQCGEKVVVSGAQKLSNNSEVTIIQE